MGGVEVLVLLDSTDCKATLEWIGGIGKRTLNGLEGVKDGICMDWRACDTTFQWIGGLGSTSMKRLESPGKTILTVFEGMHA